VESNDLRSLVEKQLALSRRLKARIRELKDERRAPLAVVGMALRFPGGITTPEDYWRFLLDETDVVREIPADRPGLCAVHDPRPNVPGRSYVSRAALLDDVANFDAAFFGISRREAEAMDPQQRLLLETSWEAMERAGVAVRRSQRLDAGVFVGIMSAEYTERLVQDSDTTAIDPYYGTGGGHAFAAGRVSYALGLSGPSMSVDTACSSSLVALHSAVQSLRRGECRYALVGGSNLLFSSSLMVSLSQSRALAPDGRCKPFLAAADGYGRGEGVGVVLVMRLADAERECRPVLAVLRGSAVNHDGASSGLTVPNGPAQQEVIRSALADAGLQPADVSYIEAHGTGTALGDPIEVGALHEVFDDEDRRDALLIGSVKSRLGHLEAAAGMAGLIKLVLMLRHHTVPAARTPADGALNQHIPWSQMRLSVPDANRPWHRGAVPKVAGISAFGLSGTNAHALLVSPDPMAPDVSTNHARHELVTVSARDRDALIALVARVGSHLLDVGTVQLAGVCHTLRCGRMHFTHRVAATGHSPAELARGLCAALDVVPEDTAHRTVTLRVTDDPAPLLAGVQALEAQFPALAIDGDADPVDRLRNALLSLGIQLSTDHAAAAEPADLATLEWGGRSHPLLSPDPHTCSADFLEALAALYTAGADLRWEALRPEGARFDPDVPTYAFQRKRYWIDEPSKGGVRAPEEDAAMVTSSGITTRRAEVSEFLLTELTAILRVDGAVDRTSGFLDIGGDSFTAMILLTSAEQRYGGELSLDAFELECTIGDLVDGLTEKVLQAKNGLAGQEQP
jgi:acyl transferase domain-containing protein